MLVLCLSGELKTQKITILMKSENYSCMVKINRLKRDTLLPSQLRTLNWLREKRQEMQKIKMTTTEGFSSVVRRRTRK
jgi:hypothetical protein